jgi:hypothetical protein
VEKERLYNSKKLDDIYSHIRGDLERI